MKALGKDIKAFYNSIPEGHTHDGDDLGIEFDVENLKDNELYDLKDWGFIFKSDDDITGVKFSTAFRKWQEQQTHVNVLVSVDKEHLEAALLALKNIEGLKIIK